MKYKVGDKVRIKSREWIDKRIGTSNNFIIQLKKDFARCISYDCGGKIATITEVVDGGYRIDLDKGLCIWSELLFENETNCISEELVKDIADIINKHNLSVKIEERDGGLFVKPIEKEEDFPIDTPCMCFLNGWSLRYYAGNKKCFIDGMNSNSLGEGKPVESTSYKVIIPFSSFNVDDIESSLKYNIVK